MVYNTWKHGSFLPCINSSRWWWWCNGVEDYFLAPFRPLSAKWALFKYQSLLEYCCCSCPFMTTVYPARFSSMWQSSNKLKLVSWTREKVHCTLMALTVTRSQSSRAPLGCTGDAHHGCAADFSTAALRCYHVTMDKDLWGMCPAPSWFYATKN